MIKLKSIFLQKNMKTFFKKYKYTFLNLTIEQSSKITITATGLNEEFTGAIDRVDSNILTLEDVWSAIDAEAVDIEAGVLKIKISIKIGLREIIEYFEQPLERRAIETRILNVLEWQPIEPICYGSVKNNNDVSYILLNDINKLPPLMANYIRFKYTYPYVSGSRTFGNFIEIESGDKKCIIYHNTSGEVWLPYTGEFKFKDCSTFDYIGPKPFFKIYIDAMI